MAERFGEWRAGITGSPELEWVDDLVDRLRDRPDIVELGCGGAVEPTLRLAAASGGFTGIDISEHQLRLARERCPEGDFVLGDMTTIELDPQSFDAVVSLYAFNHIPRADLPGLIKRIGGWLRPDGYFLATFGVSDSESVQDDWLGVPMFFASHPIGSNRAFVREAGFAIVADELSVITEPGEGEGRFQWILAWKP